MPEFVTQPVEVIVRLRLLVAVLGGAAHARWWRTELLTPAGLRFLERLYPRTTHLAALRATGVAARTIHDSSIGRGEVYHLFRLPEPLEVELETVAGSAFLDQAVWPKHVKGVCRKDRSIAIAHGLEDLCEVVMPSATNAKRTRRKKLPA